MATAYPAITDDNADLPQPAPQELPDNIEIETVEDLNGSFAPQSGNIQPTVVGVPEPVQVEIHHPADDDSVSKVTVKTDDWAYIAASVVKDLITEPQIEPNTEPTPEMVTPDTLSGATDNELLIPESQPSASGEPIQPEVQEDTSISILGDGLPETVKGTRRTRSK